MTSLFKISEQVQRILGKGNHQELIEAVKQAYATVAKLQFYESKQDGVSEINGSFVYTFKDNEPILDPDLDIYYTIIPSSYLELPCQYGVNQVSFMKGQNTPFVMQNGSSFGMYSGLKSSVMGGNQTFYVEGIKMFFPKFTANNKGNVLMKLGVALDVVDVDEDLNIPGNVVDDMINLVVQKYAPQEKETPDTLK